MIRNSEVCYPRYDRVNYTPAAWGDTQTQMQDLARGGLTNGIPGARLAVTGQL